MFRPLSSLWLLSLMLLSLIGAALVLMWILSSWALSRTFNEVGRAVVLDDLGEYAVLYARGGAEGVRDLFTSGEHESDQMVRILGRAGETILDIPISATPNGFWPELSGLPAVSPGETTWHRHLLPGGATLTIGRRGLPDGAELWFGRTDKADREAIARMHRLIALTMAITALFAVGPVIWFSHRVLRPVQGLIGDARRLVSENSSLQRLEAKGAIAELREFASAFNLSLDRVQALTEELETANDQLAHELRTPLARIRGNVEVILSSKVNPLAHEAAERAIAEIERASRVVQMILSIRAGDALTMKLHAEIIAPRELVSEICELYSASAEERKLKLSIGVVGSERAIMADRQRLQQALCNLLDNALAYTPNGGEIRVELEFGVDRMMIRVQDSGPGLNESDPGRIWRRFVRGSASTTTLDIPGIGLGLCLVQAVARAHRGEVGATNRPEGGAVFWIRLPYV